MQHALGDEMIVVDDRSEENEEEEEEKVLSSMCEEEERETLLCFQKEGIEIESVLQNAIYGQILLAKFVRSGRKLAIKAISKRLANDGICLKGTPVFEDHFLEVDILRKIRERPHPNLLGLADDRYQMETKRFRFLALPFISGGELFSVIKEKGSLSEDRCKFIAGGIARGLRHLHEKLGFCHNDISLENVLVRNDGTPVICDFGLAQVIGSAWDSDKHISGKLPYQAPEIYSGTATVASGKMDVFSFGVALFVMLTGIPPFEVPDPLYDMRYKYIQGSKMKVLLKLWHVSLSDEVVNLLTGMLFHDPSSRMGLDAMEAHPWMNKRSRSRVVETMSTSPDSVFNFGDAYANSTAYSAREESTRKM